MNKLKLRRAVTAAAGVLASVGLCAHAQAQTAQPSDPLINALVKKGILTADEARQIKAEVDSAQTNSVSASKWKINPAIKDIELFGDLRFRYEYRSAETIVNAKRRPDEGYRERYRYALRLGIRGDLLDDFYYGLRLETSPNPRSTWVTLGGNNKYPYPSPSDKVNDVFGIGQAYLGWRPASWLDIVVGRMPNPLYTTSMIWDPDINPEGAAEKFKFTVGHVDLFGTFGQFLYQDTDPDQGIRGIPSFFGSRTNQNDVFLLAWQLGANIKFTKDISFKIAPTLYNYTGLGQNPSGANIPDNAKFITGAGLSGPFVGQGSTYIYGWNPYDPGAYDPTKPFSITSPNQYINQNGINNLLVFELPGEINFKLGRYNARVFGDYAVNFDGAERARAAYNYVHKHPGGIMPLTHAYTDEDKAYQLGFGVGNLGLANGQTPKKNTWEARAFFQHTEQYAVDVNLNDSDEFEGRGNMEGVFAVLAYSLTDNVIAAVRYGYAQRINDKLGTGGSNQDLPQINPITKYTLMQLDLTMKF